MNNVFERLLCDEVVNGVTLCEFNDSDDYTKYSLDALDENETVDGVVYTPHFAFINIDNDECAYVGLLYRDINDKEDVKFRKFRVVGASYEVYHDGGWCDFDTMFDLLSK